MYVRILISPNVKILFGHKQHNTSNYPPINVSSIVLVYTMTCLQYTWWDLGVHKCGIGVDIPQQGTCSVDFLLVFRSVARLQHVPAYPAITCHFPGSCADIIFSMVIGVIGYYKKVGKMNFSLTKTKGGPCVFRHFPSILLDLFFLIFSRFVVRSTPIRHLAVNGPGLHVRACFTWTIIFEGEIEKSLFKGHTRKPGKKQ